MCAHAIPAPSFLFESSFRSVVFATDFADATFPNAPTYMLVVFGSRYLLRGAFGTAMAAREEVYPRRTPTFGSRRSLQTSLGIAVRWTDSRSWVFRP